MRVALGLIAMPFFVLQTALLILVAYVLGAFAGCFLHRLLGSAFSDDDDGLARETVGGRPPPVIETSPVQASVRDGDTLRFERALTGSPQQKETNPGTARGATMVPEPAAAPDAPSSNNSATSEPSSPVAAAAAAAAASVATVSHLESERAHAAAETQAGRSAEVDDLERIHWIDGATAVLLKERGITRYSQIAAWTSTEIEEIEALLDGSRRVSRENWIEQANILASGGTTAYARARDEGREWNPDAHRSGNGGDKATNSAPAAAVATEVVGDQLQSISGIDARIEGILNEVGVYRYEQIANWSAADVARIEERLKEPGRVARNQWIEQAQLLSGGGAETVGRPLDQPGDAPRSDLAGMRSVRSEALVGAGRDSGIDDDLKRIRGIGVLIEKKLKSLGVTSYEQVANWTRGDIDRISETLDFKGRIERENWVEQARILASGGQTDFSRRIDRGEI